MLEPFLPLVCSESWRALGKLVKWEAGLWCSQPLTFASFPLFCEILLFLGHRMPWLLRSCSQAKIQYHPSQSISFLKHFWSLIVEWKLFFPLPDVGIRRLVGEIFKKNFVAYVCASRITSHGFCFWLGCYESWGSLPFLLVGIIDQHTWVSSAQG